MTPFNKMTRFKTLDRRDMLLKLGAGAGAFALAGNALLHSSPASATAPGAQVGQPAPDFTSTDTKGVERKLAGLRGKIVVLEWTNADCPFVMKHYKADNMQALQRDAEKAGVVWLSVISSAPGEQGHVDPAKANDLTASRKAAPAGILLDPKGSIGRSYGAQVTPHMYVIDATGVLRYAGGIDSLATTNIDDITKAQPLFRDAMTALVKGEAVKISVSRPYGCTIKYQA